MSARWRISTTRLHGVSVEACWRPMEGDLGGDFFDVIDLGDDRTAVVVGDAAGHGPAAAAVADDLRAELRRGFRRTTDPVEVFASLDRLLRRSTPLDIATATCVIVDAATRELTMVNAGHPPVIVVDAHHTEVLDGPADTLLGVPSERRQRTRPLAHGAVVFLYTDGLIERRYTPFDDSLKRMMDICATITSGIAGASEVARRVMGRFGVPTDDATVLALQLLEAPPGLAPAPTALDGGVVLRLYVDRRDLRSDATEAVVRDLAERLRPSVDVQVEVVDIRDPHADMAIDGVLAAPTVVRVKPLPRVRVIGALRSAADLARDLQLPLPPENR